MYSGLKPKVVRSPEQTTRSGCMSLISLIARSSSVGTKCGPPQCRSEIWAMLNAPLSTPAMARSVKTRALRPVQAVDVAELRAQVREQRLRVQTTAHEALEQLAGQVLTAVTVHVLAQPVTKRPEVACACFVVKVRQLPADPLPELGRD